ncbi:Uncharacterized protein Rs2_39466 [Raphanus sativus]|nr:Uncharacterized protein Rs2_39466 [Raphanus sativus]
MATSSSERVPRTPVTTGFDEQWIKRRDKTALLMEKDELFSKNYDVEAELENKCKSVEFKIESKREEVVGEKEDDLHDAERKVLSEKKNLNRAKEAMEKRERVILEASLNGESLQEELKRANMELASQARGIEELRLKLRERYEEIAAMQSYLFLREREPDQIRVEISIKDFEVSVAVSEFDKKSQCLSQANKIVKRQEDEIYALQRALKEKEEEIEFSVAAKRLEQERLRETDANLKKQTEDWLVTQDEVSKLPEETMKFLGEANETMGNFRRVKKLITDERFEIVYLREALLSSKEQMTEKELLVEKQLEEQRRSMLLYMQSLRDACTEVESERVKLRVAEAKNFEHDLEVQSEALTVKEDDITEMSYNLEEKAEEEENKMAQRILRDHGYERSIFPIFYQYFFHDNSSLRMALANYDKECKVCTRPFKMFTWQSGRTVRYKKTEMFQSLAKLKNICQVCQLNLEYGLSVQDRDTTLNITTREEKYKCLSAIEENISTKITRVENEKDRLRELYSDLQQFHMSLEDKRKRN